MIYMYRNWYTSIFLIIRGFTDTVITVHLFMLLQKGDQVKNMAQGAMDNVKNTLGMGDKN